MSRLIKFLMKDTAAGSGTVWLSGGASADGARSWYSELLALEVGGVLSSRSTPWDQGKRAWSSLLASKPVCAGGVDVEISPSSFSSM